LIKESNFLFILLCIVIFLSYILFEAYIFTIIIAAVFSIATSDIYGYFFKKTKSRFISSALLLFFMFSIIFLPITYFFFKAVAFLTTLDMGELQTHIKSVLNSAQSILASIPGIEEKVKEVMDRIDSAALGRKALVYLGSFTAGSATFVIDAGFIAMFYFMFNIYGRGIVDFIIKATPMEEKSAKTLLNESASVVKSVFFSLFITALLQGALFGVFVYFYGLDALFLGILYGFASMVPVVGGALVWIPTAIYMFLYVSPVGALALSIYSIVVLATLADNFLRPFVVNWLNNRVLKTEESLNEIIVFFAMIAGVGQFGFFGIILGPAIMAMLVSVIKVFQKLKNSAEELSKRSQNETA